MKDKYIYLMILGITIVSIIMFSYMVRAECLTPDLNIYSNTLNGTIYVPGHWYKISVNVSTTDNSIEWVQLWTYNAVRPPYEYLHFFQIDLRNSTIFFDGNFAYQYDVQVGLLDYQWAYYNSTWWLYDWNLDIYVITDNDYPLIDVVNSTPPSTFTHNGGAMDIYYRFPVNLKNGIWQFEGMVSSYKWENGTMSGKSMQFPRTTFTSNYGGSIPTPPPINNPYNIDIELWIKAVCLFMILILLFVMGYLIVKAGTEVAEN